jgi:hypothetical protein
MSFKRKNEDAGRYPALERARPMHLTSRSLEDGDDIFGALGNSTSSAHSNLLLNDKGDDEDHNVLILDTDKDLLLEMDEL